MANNRSKIERSKAKDARQTPAPDAETRHKAKRRKVAKPYRLEYRVRDFHILRAICPGWSTLKRYETLALALDALESHERKTQFFDYRIVTDGD